MLDKENKYEYGVLISYKSSKNLSLIHYSIPVDGRDKGPVSAQSPLSLTRLYGGGFGAFSKKSFATAITLGSISRLNRYTSSLE